MCAGGEGRDVCQVRNVKNYQNEKNVIKFVFKGFGGAPLMINENGVTNQVGIMSFGSENCGGLRVPSVYTSIAHFYNWIQENIPIE
jgi:prostasin